MEDVERNGRGGLEVGSDLEGSVDRADTVIPHVMRASELFIEYNGRVHAAKCF